MARSSQDEKVMESLDTSQDKRDLQEQLNQLDHEIETRNVQITDLQQKLMEIDCEEKQKHRWDNLNTMVEAKCALKWLFQQAVDAKLEAGVCTESKEDLQFNLNETTRKCESLHEEMRSMKNKHEVKLHEQLRQHEDKMLYLLRQLPKAASQKSETPEVKNLLQKLEFQSQEIEALSNLHEKLQSKETEMSDLKKQLTVAKLNSTNRLTLLPQIVSPSGGSSPFVPHAKPVAKPKRVTSSYADDSLTGSEVSDTDDPDNDPDWKQTPYMIHVRRIIKKARDRTEQSKLPLNTSTGGCKCKVSNCSNKLCKCRKTAQTCGENCGCDQTTCMNKQGKENFDAEEQSTMNSLLNTTFEVTTTNETVKLSPLKPSVEPMKIATMSPMRKANLAMKERNDNVTSASSSESSPEFNVRKRFDFDDAAGDGLMHRKKKLLSKGHKTSFFSPLN